MVVANFTPTNSARGYMEAFMDWRLVLRDEETLRSVAGGLLGLDPRAVGTFTDPHGNVAYLVVRKP